MSGGDGTPVRSGDAEGKKEGEGKGGKGGKFWCGSSA